MFNSPWLLTPTPSCVTGLLLPISPDSTNQPVHITQTLTSSFYKPQGHEKQIEPISSVEIALKITTANVEMYYLHPPNPIYFMHILPSKLNTACSLYRKSLWKDSLYLISVLSWPSRFLTIHRRQSVQGSSGCCRAVSTGRLAQHVLPDSTLQTFKGASSHT